MKIALFICGYIRTFKNNIDNMKKNIIQDHEVDIFINISINQEDDKYFNNDNDINNIYTELNPKLLVISNNVNYSNNNNKNKIYNINYRFHYLNEYLKHNNYMNYDIVIKYRPDLFILNKINFIKNDNYIIIPSDTKIDKSQTKYNNKNICDIFAYGNYKLMSEYFQMFDYLDDIYEENIYNGELLNIYLDKKKIPYKLLDIEYNIVLSIYNTIAICGDSSTGKTTLSKNLKSKLNNSFILECDRYHKWERGHEKWKKYTHLNPEANYIGKMNNDVFELKMGKNIYQVDYDHSNGKFIDKQLIEHKENIIVCGLHTLYNDYKLYNLSVFMDVEEQLRIKWKIDRDMKKRNYSYEKIIQQINDRKNDYNNFILPQKNKSDIIIYFYLVEEEIYMKIFINEIIFSNKILKSIKEYKYNIDNICNYNNKICITFDKYENYFDIVSNIILNFI